jgi:glucose dehydrogenase
MQIWRFIFGVVAAGAPVFMAQAQTDWPNYSHDAGGSRYTPLKQINEKNVAQLKLAWTFDPTAPVTDTPRRGAAGLTPLVPPAASASAGPPRPPRVRQSKTTPLVIGNTMYFSTPYSRVVALDAETGTKIWEYLLPFSPASRGISYWPGEGQDAPEIFIGTSNGRLIALNANTGKPVPGFGEDGILNVRVGVADEYPKGQYGISSPPAIYKNLVITGCQLQEMPSKGPSGDVRAWDVRTGKLVWTFHTLPRPGELNHDDWQEDQWQDRSGLNAWGIMTVDVQNGIAFLPIGTPTTDFYGGDRKGKNLYGSSLVAVDAETGQLKWYFQTSYHDNWDYDVAAAPVMITVKRNGKEIPAVAQTTKQGLMFILDRFTGKPIYPVEDRPVVNDNIPPGDEPSPVQPFPVKPLPLTRNAFAPDELAKLTPEHDKACKDLLSLEGGVLTGGPYAEYGPKLRVIFPGWTGGGNWGGSAYDPKLGYVFVNTKTDGMLDKLVKRADGTYDRVGPDKPPSGVKDSFQVGPWPCQAPPWGEFVWRVPLGSFPELDALGIPTTGRTNVGGAIATAGGVTFIAASEDHKFRAFDSKNGKILWVTDLKSTGAAVPVSYLGKNGKQYVAIMSNGSGGKDPVPPTMYVYSLP